MGIFDVYEVRDSIEENIIKIYDFGSKVYRTDNNNSDADKIAVVESKYELLYQYITDCLDITVFSEKMFIKAIKEHKINALECIFQEKEDNLVYFPYFKLDLSILRKEISSVSSNSYVKCKKKLQQGDVYIGLKSLFHSLRILMFGIQIAKYGRIVDYTEANNFLDRIMKIGDNWDELKKEFQPLYNSLKSEFKKLAPL